VGTRLLILDRAVELASREGLEGLTIGRLSSELKMSKSGLFGHFGSKEELQLATIDAAGKRFFETVIGPAQEAREGSERLRTYCERWVDYLEARVFSGGCFFANATAEFDSRPGVVREKLKAGQLAWTGELSKQAGLAGADEPDQLAFEIAAIVLGANTAHELLDDQQAFERARKALRARLAELL
jgi:AcrR family transcriptional regulator